ncbi:MAG: hypothetical protein R3F60_29615 [bacterium]
MSTTRGGAWKSRAIPRSSRALHPRQGGPGDGHRVQPRRPDRQGPVGEQGQIEHHLGEPRRLPGGVLQPLEAGALGRLHEPVADQLGVAEDVGERAVQVHYALAQQRPAADRHLLVDHEDPLARPRSASTSARVSSPWVSTVVSPGPRRPRADLREPPAAPRG